MTSRSSFFNLLREDFKRRLWTFILASIVFFGTFPVAFTMLVQTLVSNYEGWNITQAEFVDRVSAQICDYIGLNGWLALVAGVGAIICGVSGFAYLHSRKQIDFYHSLPVKREKIFAVRFVNGILIYAIPYLIGLLYAYIISAVFGVMTKDVFLMGLLGFLIHLMGYSIMYLVTIIAMMLTGKLVIAFFGIVVLNAYAPAIYGLALLLRETFFTTTYISSATFEDIFLNTRWLSPFSYYFTLLTNVDGGTASFWLELLTFVILAAVLGVVTLVLYKKRASEKADIAMSFKISEPIIRILLAIPVGILAGMLFFSVQYDSGRTQAIGWLVFGSVLGAFLAHGIIESLYQGDVKKCLSHKLQMAATIVVTAVVPLLFYYDVFGYDSYLPKKDDIAHMAVTTYDMRFGGGYRDANGDWISANEYALEEMQITEIDAAYELAELLAKHASMNRSRRFFGYSYYYEQQYATDSEVHVTDFIVQYTLKNGSVVTREYEYNFYGVLGLLARIYEDEEYKMTAHPIFALEQAGWIPYRITCASPVSPVTGEITEGLDYFLEVYKKELLAMDFEYLQKTSAIGELSVYYNFTDSDGKAYTDTYADSLTCLVYPSMTQTLALIKESGYSMQPIADARTVKSITISYYGSKSELLNYLGIETSDETVVEDSVGYVEYYDEYAVVEEYGKYDYYDVYVEITDPAEIKECLENLIPARYTAEFGPFPRGFGYANVDVLFTVNEGYEDTDVISWENSFRFAKDNIPAFVIDRILSELE